MANERDKVSLAEWKAGRGRSELPPAARAVFVVAVVTLLVACLLIVWCAGLMVMFWTEPFR